MTEEPTKNQDFFKNLSRQQSNTDQIKSQNYTNFKYLSENLRSLTINAINYKKILENHYLKTLILQLIYDVDKQNNELLKDYFKINQHVGGKKVATKKSKK